MLIQSDRITKEDYEIWKEYEEIDQINSLSSNLNKKIEKSQIEIKKFIQKGNCYLGVSWGKDSVVTADIILRSGINIPIVHLYCIPSHNFECDKVRNYFLKIYPNCNYKEIIVDYSNIYSSNFCSTDQDKLTDIEFYKGFKEAEKLFGINHISGVRGQESNIRTLKMKRWGMTTENTCTPIGYWNDMDVFAYLYKYNLPVHPNYGMLGNGRWKRERIRVAEIGDIHGNGGGRVEWEQEYYSDILAKIRKK